MSALNSQSNATDVARAWVLLDALTDPEIPVVTLRELGILRDVRAGDAGLEVVITPTYSGCPAMGAIEDDVKALLAANGLQGRVVTLKLKTSAFDVLTRDVSCGRPVRTEVRRSGAA